MSKPVKPPESPKDIERIELKDALEERYLAYALSTIMHRALPDSQLCKRTAVRAEDVKT